MIPDRDLLRQYADQGDEAAFAEVVRRHVDWVYSSARRLVAGDAHLAEDITQSVFTDLARKAGKISRYDAPGAWLHTATRFTAAKAVDRERRRHEREQEAFTMQHEPSAPEIRWEQMRPILDDAIGQLGMADRQAVVMRFFEGKSHREIGEVTGLSEDTARKRVERAVEKLHTYFSRKGITISAGLLTEAITVNSVQAAPAVFAASVAGVSLSQAGVGTSGILLFLFSMTTKAKIITSALVLLLFAGVLTHELLTASGKPSAHIAASPAGSTRPANPSVPTQVEAPVQPPTAVDAPLAGNSSSQKETAARAALLAKATGTLTVTSKPTQPTLTDDINNLINAHGKPTVSDDESKLWEPDSAHPGSQHFRPEVRTTFLNDDPQNHVELYYLSSENHFFIRIMNVKGPSGPPLIYGPFEGDPWDVLDLWSRPTKSAH